MVEEINLLNEALGIAKAGLKVFPLSFQSKIPLKNTKGFKEATTDEETVFNMFMDNPQANIGVSMAGTNYFVLDIDTHGKNKREGIESLEQLVGDKLKELNNVVSVKTANGGLHLFFSYPDTYEVKQRINFRPSIDIIKGYVVGAGSVIKRQNGSIGKYEIDNGSLSEITEAPKWLLELVTAKEEPKNNGITLNFSNTKRAGKTFTATFLEELVQGQSEPGRNNWLTSKTGKLLSLGMNSNEAYELIHAINESFVTPKLPDSVVNTIFESILKAENKKGVK